MSTEIERHPNLLDEKLLVIYQDIVDNIITFHRLPFKLFETLRTKERQQKLFDDGFSKTLNSRHLPNKLGKSEAMDIVVYIDGKWSWDNKHLFYYEFLGSKIMEKYSGILKWGRDFKSFKDYPHFELIKSV